MVRFILGRAGSGKTWRCLEAIRARLGQDAAAGNKLLLIVPEQASFQMERALIETPDLAGYTRCEVLSFQRLAYRIFAETGADPRRSDQTIGSSGRLMVIRRLIRRERSALHLFGRVADKPGLIKELAAAIDELMRENIPPETLADIAEQAEEQNALQAARLADLTRLYRAYLDYLLADRIDPAQYLNLAAERLSACSWLNDAEVWVDGFAGFTAQESNLLVQLARRARSMEITLLVDPQASAIRRDELPLESFSLFARTERTLVRLRREFKTAGLAIDDAVLLPRSPRFKNTELAQLEQHLFRSAAPSAQAPDLQVISLNQLPDCRGEVSAAIAEIQRLTRQSNPPMRYRDIAIIVRDLEPYHDLIQAAMRTHGIPCFIDCRQPTAHHPLIELIRGLLAIAADDCRLDSVRMTLKTGLLPIATPDLDLFENYLIAHGLQGRTVLEQTWSFTRFFQNKKETSKLSVAQQSQLAHINEIRAQWLALFATWLQLVSQNKELPGRTWAEGLMACLQTLGVGQRLYQWADDDEADGRTDQAEAHRQVWLDFTELLDEFVRALGSEPMRIQEFRETLEAGLAEFNLGLAPPTLDQVLVGAIERSRHPNLRAVLVLGFDEAHFPMKRAEDRLLGDQERELLERQGLEVRPSRRRQLLDERMLAYIAMTRAGERLWVSYARTDHDGNPLKPSAYVEDLLAALPGLQFHHWEDPRRSRKPIWLTRPSELAGGLSGEFRYRPALDRETDPTNRGIWNALYDTARQMSEWQQTLTRCLAGLKHQNRSELTPEIIRRVFASPLSASVSRLERFAACPFAHFVEYSLELRPRVQAQMGQIDLGLLSHAILEMFGRQLADTGQSLGELEDDAIAERVDAIAQQVSAQWGPEIMLAEARNAYLFDRSRAHLRRALRWQRDAAKVGQFRPHKIEFPFGFSEDAALQLTTPRGRTILLRGRIDRIDLADLGQELLGTVIDYKRTTNRTLDLTQVYHGLSLQLIGYLLALQKLGKSLTGRPIQPVGAFYLPLLEPYKSVAHPNEEKEAAYRWRGIADAAALPHLDNSVQPGVSSRYFSARLTQKGEPYANSDLTQRDQLSRLMAHVGRRMGELADALLEGNITIRPYRLARKTPCSFCPYQSVCRYEIHTQPPRVLESLKKEEIFRRLDAEADA